MTECLKQRFRRFRRFRRSCSRLKSFRLKASDRKCEAPVCVECTAMDSHGQDKTINCVIDIDNTRQPLRRVQRANSQCEFQEHKLDIRNPFEGTRCRRVPGRRAIKQRVFVHGTCVVLMAPSAAITMSCSGSQMAFIKLRPCPTTQKPW
jgi:hypothetical protein